MEMNRRELLTGVAGMVVASQVGARAAAAEFPRKDDFSFAEGVTYINGAFTHPMPKASADAYRASIARRSTIGSEFVHTPDVRPLFASLVNARPSEIGFIANTSTGENFVVEARSEEHTSELQSPVHLV